MIKKISLFIYFIPTLLFAQNKNVPPCSLPEGSQFDFWIGTWQLTYNDTMKATNHIEKELGGCVIFENFSDPSQQFKGKSWSVYNPASHQWQQTWVDNQGGYIVLTGSFEKDKMILTTAPATTANGLISKKRMIYYNIKPDSLDWSWESTSDDGKTWKPVWNIHYVRNRM